MKKRIISLLLVLSMIFSAAAMVSCDGGEGAGEQNVGKVAYEVPADPRTSCGFPRPIMPCRWAQTPTCTGRRWIPSCRITSPNKAKLPGRDPREFSFSESSLVK